MTAADRVAGIDLAAIERRSRAGAAIAAAGFTFIAIVIGFSLVALGRLEAARAQLERTIAAKQQTLGEVEARIRSSEARLAEANRRLAQTEDQLNKTAFLIGTGKVQAAATQLAQATQAPAQGDVGRVYFQIRSEAQHDLFKRCAAVLVKQDYRVPAAQLVSDRGPPAASVRFFHKGDAEEAGRLAQSLSACADAKVSAAYIPGYESSTLVKPRQFEVWFAPGQA